MKFVPKSLTRSMGNTSDRLKANSPHIFFGFGVVATVGGAILACRATLKLEENVDNIKGDLQVLKNRETLIPEKEYKKELTMFYGQSALKLGQLYAPAAIVGLTGLGLITGSHIQLARRNAVLTASLAAWMKAFDEYRARVREEIGAEREEAVYIGAKAEDVEIDGKKHKALTVHGMPSPYARFFDQFSSAWEKDPERNRFFLQTSQNFWNDVLQVKGHVMLNEVYDSLGLERSSIGQIVGWVIGGDGDGYIDFGLYDGLANARFINNLEWSCLLDFNVDGVVYDKI